MKKVHILYLTTDCNLRCPYCYEQQNGKKRPIKKANRKQIDSFLNNIITTEPNEQSSICLFGGEPLLEFDKIMYVYSKCKQFKYDKRYYYKDIALNIITNGTLLHKYIKDLKELLFSPDITVSLDVSYDGINQHLRTGSSTIVEDNLVLLNDHEIPFGISYTVTSNNYESKILLSELVSILERFYAGTRVFSKKRIKINLDAKSIPKEYDKLNRDTFFTDMKQHLEYLYAKYKIPLCSAVCHLCKRCHIEGFDGLSYSIPGHRKFVVQPIITEKLFSHF